MNLGLKIAETSGLFLVLAIVMAVFFALRPDSTKEQALKNARLAGYALLVAGINVVVLVVGLLIYIWTS